MCVSFIDTIEISNVEVYNSTALVDSAGIIVGPCDNARVDNVTVMGNVGLKEGGTYEAQYY